MSSEHLALTISVLECHTSTMNSPVLSGSILGDMDMGCTAGGSGVPTCLWNGEYVFGVSTIAM